MSAFLFLFFQAAPGCLVIPNDSPAVKSIVAKILWILEFREKAFVLYTGKV